MVSLSDIESGLNSAQDFLSNNNPLSDAQKSTFKNEGFALPANFSADGTGLPFSKVKPNRDGSLRRNIITWFVPEFGTVKMYINPQNITYNYKKIIQRERTKGGYTLQYWGEDLTTLTIAGSTGSSGVEGINALYEIYRAEQYAFDSTGLMIAANNSSQNAANGLVGAGLDALGGAIGGAVGAGIASGIGGLLGASSPGANMASNNFMNLAQLAFTVEMYYNGWVFRGYFDNMSVTETTDLLLSYNITFIVTQRRGYRGNYLPWHRSPNGPSQYESPHSFFNEMG